MKANELRIGNLIQDIKYKSPMRIVQFYGNTMFELDSPYMDYTDYRCDADLDNYEPIPITEEWLIKFGFKRDSVMDGETRRLNNFNIGKLTKGYFIEGGVSNDKTSINIEYVHQLQNLYFSLTGEELTIR